MRQATSAIRLRIRCEEESMPGQAPQAGSDPTLKVGSLLVGSGFENVPPMMQQYFHVRVSSLTDPNLDTALTTLHRGIFGLPIASRRA